MGPQWKCVLAQEFTKTYYKDLEERLDEAYECSRVYPPREDVFSAFEHTDYDQVKVVILGQDPYHGPGQAHGLSFSVQHGVKIPPSLRNIYKELAADVGFHIPNHGNLEAWTKQGILLLNAILTVEEGKPSSHKKFGWGQFTDEVIRLLNDREEGIVFVLWGNFAISKKSLITNPQHRIVESVHPSPLSASRGFLGSACFSKVNNLLTTMGHEGIDWTIDEPVEQLTLDL